MFHTKIYQNLIINEDFEKKFEGEGHNFTRPLFSQKVKIFFLNQRFSELFDNIRT